MSLKEHFESYFAKYHPHRCYLGLIFYQGKRTMIQINAPANELPTLLQERPSVGNDPKSGKHRPEVKGHAEQIKQYIVENATQNKPWILGSLTANVAPEQISVEELGRGLCIVVIPHNVKLDITDGQHRSLAIKDINRNSNLIGHDSFPITVVLEGSFKQCQTDFLDLAQAKPVNQTFLSSFSDSVRHKITEKIINNVLMFKNKTDKFNKAPGRNEKLIYTTKYIATSVSCAFTDNPNDELEKYDVETHADFLAKCFNQFFSECKYTRYFHETNVEKLTLNEVIDFKDNCLLGVSVGVEILGRLLYCAYEPKSHSFNHKKVSQLAKLDWSRDSRLWQNNVIRVNPKQNIQNKKIAWGASAVADAVKVVKAELGWM
ncbi:MULTISPECIES: DNA sulfur modification protein DndB [Cyanophyceae]|uniref:DNA sulfur modification protein DndB n=1 Tax=Cyanophyceae TaxID=3028117 RepID=UPI0024116FB2|nr:DNA sulfur modification protein DndB [Coleofasciculus sp. FACHB-125]